MLIVVSVLILSLYAFLRKTSRDCDPSDVCIVGRIVCMENLKGISIKQMSVGIRWRCCCSEYYCLSSLAACVITGNAAADETGRHRCTARSQ